jgi:ribonucleoside-diphosphate reductase alpha chain
MYLEPWHPDVEAFLELKKNHGVESARARDLFYGLWMPDLFMQRVADDKPWSLICPSQCPELVTTHGKEWEALYRNCEKCGLVQKTLPARKLWSKILTAQLETGTPYLMFKDTVNAKSNQKTLGTIRGSNLCSEICEFTSAEEAAVCTLASIALPEFVEQGLFNYKKLEDVVQHTVKSLERVIDVTFYPIPEARRSNMRHRPIGIGANGFHDVLFKLRIPWESREAQELNKCIFESMYWAAMRASVELAKVLGHYSSFTGSPLSEGKFQFDLWQQQPSTRYDWEALRRDVVTYGSRHSLLIALMPTASSAQIIGNTEGVDALTSNLYVRRVSSGEYVVANKYLQCDLEERGLWCGALRELLIAHKGSVQNLPIPDTLKQLYKCAFEVSHKSVLDMAIGRGPFVCQSQSMNLHIKDTNRQNLTRSHFYAHKHGLKTASYYVRTQSKVSAVPVTVRQELLLANAGEEECTMCSA